MGLRCPWPPINDATRGAPGQVPPVSVLQSHRAWRPEREQRWHGWLARPALMPLSVVNSKVQLKVSLRDECFDAETVAKLKEQVQGIALRMHLLAC